MGAAGPAPWPGGGLLSGALGGLLGSLPPLPCPARWRPKGPEADWEAAAPKAGRPWEKSQCFQEVFNGVTRELESLGELHRRELASLSWKVSKLKDDKEGLEEKLSKLEWQLPRAREVRWAPVEEEEEPAVQKEEVHFAAEEPGEVLEGQNRRPDVDLWRCSKLRSMWEELSDETVYAFSPFCTLRVVNVHRQIVLGENSANMAQVPSNASSWNSGLRAASQEDQSIMSLCFVKSVLHPNAHPRLFWYLMTLLALLYDVVTIPLTAFHLEAPVLSALDLIILIFWSFDIFITFRTGYYSAGKVELRPWHIARNYFKTWFCMDAMVVAVGWTSELAIISSSSSVYFRAARFMRILRILRLLRLAKLKQILDHIEDRINSNVIHLLLVIVKLVSGFSVIVHFTACGWYAIGMSAEDGWPSYDTYDNGGDVKGTTFWYAAALRWTLAQVNGRTDIDDRRNMRERMFTCLVAGCLAIILMAVFISSITAAMMELGNIAEDRKKKVRRINEFLKKNQISSSLTALIKHHSLEQKTMEESQEDDCQILSYLPKAIQSDLMYEIRAPLLLQHPLFSSINVESKKVMWRLCNEAMAPLLHEKDVVVFDVNDSCSRMLIVVKGVLAYRMPEEGEVREDPSITEIEEGWHGRKSAAEGQRISEATLWMVWHNCGRLTTVIPSYVVALDAAAFGKAMKQHLGAHARSIMYARAFVERMREQELMTDVMDIRVNFKEP